VIFYSLLVNLPIKSFGYFSLVTNLGKTDWLATVRNVRTAIMASNEDIFIPELH
jgi:hypothetical protein